MLGKKTIRKDGIAKVTGKEIFASDLSFPNMLIGRVLKSTYAHARVKSLNVAKAEKMGAVTLTPDEIPDVTYCPRLVSVPEATYKDWKVLAHKSHYVGEPIGAVAAESEEKAQKALEAIEVNYEVLNASFDAIDSMKPEAEPIHEKIYLKDELLIPENNVGCKLSITEGDPQTFENSDVTIERTYSTSRRYHNQLEPKSVVVRPEANGGISIWSTTQTIHNTRLLLHEIFGIPMGKIRIYKVALGGSFGSSIHVNPVVPIAVGLALKSRRPIKLSYTREEDIRDHCSYQMIFKLKLGANKEGKLTGGRLETNLDIGAHQIQAYPLLGCVVGWWVSLYKLPYKEYEGKAVYTNKVPSCAFRGYGNPQISWVVETMMDELAEKIGIDPLDFRLANYIGEGDLFWGQGPSVKSIIKSCGVEEILTKGAKMVDWYNRPDPSKQTGRFKRGWGVGRGYHTSSAGAPVPSAIVDFGGAMLKMNEDGTFDYISALMDHGCGTQEAHVKIIAEELQVPVEKVNIIRGDTGTTIYDVCTHASRGVYSGGGAALKVAGKVKEKIREFAGRILDAYPHAIRIKYDDEKDQTVVFAEGIENREVTYREIAEIARHKNWGTIASLESYRQPSCPPHFTGYFVHVEVDTWTGKVKPLRVVAGADIGTVINPQLAAGQVHGGLAQGWSMTVLEDLPYDPIDGDLMNRGSIANYKVPTSQDLLDLDKFTVFFANTYEPTGPFGAKGIGEGALNPVAGTVANAIQNALGIRFYRLPITPIRILEALEKEER
ncbi:MAG: xanthine dehydrogenase family protein molybdopterin-binding subunit [Promethearchaeota archaeon]